MIGRTISHYRITRQLGAGGMGVVYEAVDTKLNRTVALKFLPPESTRDREAKIRFTREAQAASALDHPNVCNIHEIDETEDGQIFIVMACYEGETLKERIAKGPLPLDEAVDVTRQIAEGLAKAHKRDIVHRDIKPANIFVTTDGLVKILDFGLAKLAGQTQLTREGTTLGTVNYMSPELAGGTEADQRTDLWCVGVVLYEMVTGQVPFRGENQQAVIHGIQTQNPEPVTGLRTGVPLELERMIGKCLAKDPKERYQHAEDLLADLRRLRRESSSQTVTATTSGPAHGARRSRKPGSLISMAVLVGVAIVVISIIFMSNRTSVDHRSIAVLPFKTIVVDEGYEWFADGMVEAIIGHLTKIENLKVISSTSSSKFRESDLTLDEIADQLGVATILEGNVQQVGDRIHLMVKLIDAGSDNHIWSNEYDRELTDVFKVQSDVALNVVGQLETTLTADVAARIEKEPTGSMEAYKLINQGLVLWSGTFEDRNRGLELFQQATVVDPDYAEAYAQLAQKYALISVYGYRPPKEMYPEARKYALKALEIDAGNSNAFWTLGLIMTWYDWDWVEAEKHWQRGIESMPGGWAGYGGYAWHQLFTGKFDRAVELYEYVIDRNPLSAGYMQNMGEILYYARRYEESVDASLRALEMNPGYPQARMFLGLAYHSLGRNEEAVAALEADLDLSRGLKPEIENHIGTALAMVGKDELARRVLDGLLRRSEDHWVSPYSIAMIQMALGEKEEAFANLEKAFVEKAPRLSFLKIHPVFDEVKTDPRYVVMLERVGLTDQPK